MTMEETARSIGKKVYLMNCVDALTSSGSSDVDSDTESLLTAGINSLTIKTWMLKDGLQERLDHSSVIHGSKGFYTYNSSYDEKSGNLDIVVNYNYRIPFLPKSIGTVALAQRSYSHVWTGKKPTEQFMKNALVLIMWQQEVRFILPIMERTGIPIFIAVA